MHGDVSSAARALLTVPKGDRERVCRTLMLQATTADLFVQRVGRLHPVWGNGSLMAVARRFALPPEPNFDVEDYSVCFETVLRLLREFRKTTSQPDAQETQS